MQSVLLLSLRQWMKILKNKHNRSFLFYSFTYSSYQTNVYKAPEDVIQYARAKDATVYWIRHSLYLLYLINRVNGQLTSYKRKAQWVIIEIMSMWEYICMWGGGLPDRWSIWQKDSLTRWHSNWECGGIRHAIAESVFLQTNWSGQRPRDWNEFGIFKELKKISERLRHDEKVSLWHKARELGKSHMK